MSLGSYYEADYYKNYTPYESSDVGEPVPGWGTTISVAGPARLGVGQDLDIAKARAGFQRLSPEGKARLAAEYARRYPSAVVRGEECAPVEQPTLPGEPLPWWIWPLGAAVVLGGIGYYGTKKGWL